MNGMIVVNKPQGMSSTDVGRALKGKLPKNLKIGHVGTLDPEADGVLPVLLGEATKLQDILLNSDKVYRFCVEFGFETDTLDRAGSVIDRSPVIPTDAGEILGVIPHFMGLNVQVAPVYSAIKIGGKPLYQLARDAKLESISEQKLTARLTRQVMIHELQLENYTAPVATLLVRCSPGTYVRSLGRDIANALGTCATVTQISRLRSAGVSIEHAVNLNQLECLENIKEALISINNIKTNRDIFFSPDADTAKKLRCGQKLLVPRDAFVKPEEADCRESTHALDEIVMLRDENSLMMGIGQKNILSDSTVELKMKRGLLQ